MTIDNIIYGAKIHTLIAKERIFQVHILDFGDKIEIRKKSH